MADVFINDEALLDFELAGVVDAYPLWVESVKHVSRTGRLDISIADLRHLVSHGTYRRTASSLADTLVEVGYWAGASGQWIVVANDYWALAEPDEYVDHIDGLDELRPCIRCPPVNETMVSILSPIAAAGGRLLAEELADFYSVVHAEHIDE
ncbi:MAG: hypothetical protein AAGG08_19605 [Actinomycetota bacterium]